MKIKDICKLPETKLMALMNYGFPRNIGHTYAELNGVKNNPNALLIVAHRKQGIDLGLKQDKFITLDQIPEKLMGMKKALVIDHYALDILMREHYNEISNIDIDLNKVISQEDLSKMLDVDKIIIILHQGIANKGLGPMTINLNSLAKTILKGDIWKEEK